MNSTKTILLILVSLSLWGCARNQKKLLVGKWKIDNPNEYQVEYFEDGTWSSEYNLTEGKTLDGVTVTVENSDPVIWTGSWNLKNKNQLFMLHNEQPNLNETNTIISITKSTLEFTTETSRNKIIRFNRIK